LKAEIVYSFQLISIRIGVIEIPTIKGELLSLIDGGD
jgi:hypothetical protein